MFELWSHSRKLSLRMAAKFECARRGKQDDELNLFRWRLAQSKPLIGQVRCDGEPYPADPNWHDCAFNGDLPPTKEADGMKESHQKEEYCSD
jgi:hypothetical protein